MMKVNVKKLNENAKLPFRATDGSAGADLFACIENDIFVEAGERVLVPTGIAIEIADKGYGGFVFPRSSVASKFGLTLSNCVGVIDSDYRGEVKIPVINLGKEKYTIKNGDRIAQLVIIPIDNTVYTEVNNVTATERGENGFGSTGK